MGILFSPKRFFEEIGKTIQLAPMLIAVRWIGTTSAVTLPLWLLKITPFVNPWLPISENSYYFYQLVFLLPYGIVLTLLMSGISLLVLRGGGRLGTRFRAVLAIISYGLFLPWIPCVAWDLLLIFSGHWQLVWAAPFHFAAVVVEGILYAYGARKVFGASRARSVLIAVINCAVFMGLSALIVR